LRKNAGGDEVQIGDIAGVHHAAACKYPAEDQKPQRWLECAGNELREVMAQLSKFELGNDESFIDEAGQRMDECAGHDLVANQAAVP
jgi:hypothetical protein